MTPKSDLSIHPSVHPSILLSICLQMKRTKMPPILCQGANQRLRQPKCPLQGHCPKSGKTSIFAPVHQSSTGIGRVSGLVLSFLSQFINNKNGRLSLRLPDANKWHFLPSHFGVYKTPKMAFLKRQKWYFLDTKSSVSETPKMVFLKR